MHDEQVYLKRELLEFTRHYHEVVLSHRTRKISLPGRKCTPRIIRSFLGYEVQISKKRITCPDMTTARYLKIFAEIGMKEIEVPYDPTKTAESLLFLEKSFENIKILTEKTADTNKRKAAARAAFRKIRTALRRGLGVGG